ncbi:hypothetical protein O3M35_011517 [Rhynocoris fuscipes]|uniref:C3H1-type domain-containing protein n=1 Tax=Rhynocoris fuscipes TaxID=488301 RepID=A0AAW1D386_9HEMI
MPPKGKAPAPGKKAENKKKEKVIEDKTFGLKNKKGAKQQKFIQQIEKQVKSGGIPARKQEEPKKDKDAKLRDQKEMAMLFRPVQKVEKGADPKSVICAFFKQGQCTKGAKCKFSHDLSIERKSEKRSIYVDMRDDESHPSETRKEVLERAGEDGKNRPTTDIVCKYFLDAVEHNNYGWFWNCPNGENCIYRHALPPGFVLKKDKKKNEKKEDLISLEDLIEKERAALASSKFTKITLETFLAWKKRKLKEKKEAAQKEEDKKKQDYKAGKASGLSGREMFSFNPELAIGDQMDEGDEAFNSYQRDEEEEASNLQYREIELEKLGIETTDIDGSLITQAPEDRLSHHIENLIKSAGATVESTDENGEAEASGSAVAINENLFLEEDLEDLDEELEDLEIND